MATIFILWYLRFQNDPRVCPLPKSTIFWIAFIHQFYDSKLNDIKLRYSIFSHAKTLKVPLWATLLPQTRIRSFQSHATAARCHYIIHPLLLGGESVTQQLFQSLLLGQCQDFAISTSYLHDLVFLYHQDTNLPPIATY